MGAQDSAVGRPAASGCERCADADDAGFGSVARDNSEFFALWHDARNLLIVYHTWDTILTKRYGAERVRAWRAKWPVKLIGIGLTFNATAFAFILFRLDAAHIAKLFAGFGIL